MCDSCELIISNSTLARDINTDNYRHIANAVFNNTTGKLEEYRALIVDNNKHILILAGSKDCFRLSNGSINYNTPGMGIIIWEHPYQPPKGK